MASKLEHEELMKEYRSLKRLYKKMDFDYKNAKTVEELFFVWDKYGKDVPYVKVLPKMELYNLSQEMLNEYKEKCEVYEKAKLNINKKFKIITAAIFVIIVLYVGYIFLKASNFETSLAGVVATMLLGGMFVGGFYMMVIIFITEPLASYFGNKAKPDDDIEKIEKRYKDDISYYYYWLWKKGKDYWDSLSGIQFENALAALYRKLGCKVDITPAGGDQGIDLIVSNDNLKFIVQCKAHKNAIAPAALRDFYGTMTHSNYNYGIFASLSGYTKGAVEFAEDKNIRLIDINDIMDEDIM